MTEIQRVRNDLKLSEKRMRHTEGVVRAAVLLASRHFPEIAPETAELAASVRLNGYFVNLSGNENYEFINHKNEPMEKSWSAFMVSSLHHAGATADSLAATRALAKHFAAYPSVVSYQIFNEPHYPYEGIYD